MCSIDQVWYQGQGNYDMLVMHSFGAIAKQYFMNVGRPNDNAPFEIRMRLFVDDYSKYIPWSK